MGIRYGPATAPASRSTYLPMNDGSFTYLATWLEWTSRRCSALGTYSRLIVGWQIADNMGEKLIITALEKAYLERRPEPGLILHSDRGGQYVSNRFRLLIEKHRSRQSMSRKSDSYDNAFAESLFSRFKAELLQGGTFLNEEDAQTEIFEYIEMYYNSIRKHSALGYKSPMQLEKNFHLNLSNN